MTRETKCAPSKRAGDIKKRPVDASMSDFKHSNGSKTTITQQQSIQIKLIRNLKIIPALPKKIIVTTPDILSSYLEKQLKISLQKRSWFIPMSLTVSLLLTLVTSEFRNSLFLPGTTWHAVFIIGFSFSIIWLCESLFVCHKAKKHPKDIITNIENNSSKISKDGFWIVYEPEDNKDELKL